MKRENHFPRSKPTCPMSDPANLHELCRRYDPPLSLCFSCKGQQHLESQRYYYYCSTCDLEFHRGCHFYPPEIKHPFHLLHPLILTFPHQKDKSIPKLRDSSSDSDNDLSDEHKTYRGSDDNLQNCKCCGKSINNLMAAYQAYYHCSPCNFSIHDLCAVNKPPLKIENLKTHDHTLTLIPRQVPLPCDACGFSLDSAFSQVYSCLLCNYWVHRSCVYLPRVIKITRHPHRLSFTSPTISFGEHMPCGVCRRFVDGVNYGHYSCNKGCRYVVHSKCATNKQVWDGKDLEGVPEDEEEEEIEPFVRIDEVTIQHFSHEHHHLRFDANENCNSHEGKFCQACTLQITVACRFYNCIQCDFVLHEICASLPRKKNNPLHKHPLTLFHPFSPIPSKLGPEYYSEGFYNCDGCRRHSCGFVYKCIEKDCNFQLDVRCASLPDPTRHELHDHPLFFNLTKGRCMGCQDDRCSEMYLECIECEVFLGLNCATSPSVAHYKHDKHPLTLCFGEETTTDDQYWCEICEYKLDATKQFYTCNFCQVTVHLACLWGNHYIKPNYSIKLEGENVDIRCNNGNVKPECRECYCRCVSTLVLKWQDYNLCGKYCAEMFIWPFKF